MDDRKKAREHLIEEITELRRRLAELETVNAARMQVESELRHERDRAQKYLDIAGVILLVLDRDANITMINRKGCHILGCEEEQAIGINWIDNFVPPRVRDEVREVFGKIMAGETELVEYYENPVLSMSGEERMIAWHNTILKDEAGKVTGTLSSGEDITGRVFVEEELANMADLLRGVADAVVILDTDWKITGWDKGAEELFGWKDNEVIGRYVEEVFQTEYTQEYRNEIRSTLVEKGYWKREAVPRRKDNTTVDILALSSLLRSPEGTPVGVINAVIDISERKRADAALRESEAKLRSIFQAAPTGIGVVSADRLIIQVNGRVCEMLGYSREELVGKNARVLYPTDEDYEYVGREKYQQIDERGTGMVETRWRRKDGEVIDILLSSTPIDPTDRSVGVTFTALDITETKRMRERMARLNRLFLSLGADLMDNMELILEAAREVLECPYAAFCLYSRERLSSLTTAPGEERFMVEARPAGYICHDLIIGDTREPQAFTDLGETSYAATDPLIKKHGFRSYLGYPVIVEGKTVGCLSLFDQRVREFSAEDLEMAGMLAQALSVEQERLDREEDLKNFIDIASHEIRHPITIIKGYALTLEELWEELDENKRGELLKAIDQGTDRLNRLAMELLDVSRIERGYFPMKKEEIALGPFLENSLSEIRNTGIPNQLNLSVPGDIGVIEADPDRISTLIFILLDNAAKYSPVGSEIDIEAERSEEGTKVSVMDRGIGVPEDYRERIFGRFYQMEDALHHSDPGMGIGLFVAREIVEAHRGRIWCEPREGGGSIFSFTLP